MIHKRNCNTHGTEKRVEEEEEEEEKKVLLRHLITTASIVALGDYIVPCAVLCTLPKST